MKDYLIGSDVEIHELVPGRLEEALYYGKIDLGITYEPIPRKGIEFVKVADLRMGTYALKGRFADVDLTKIPFVVPVSPLEGAPSGVKGRDGWPDEKIERLIRYRVDLMSSGLELVRQGLAAIFIPRFVAHLHNLSSKTSQQLELVEMPRRMGVVRRDVYIVKREAMAEESSTRKVAQALRAICEREA